MGWKQLVEEPTGKRSVESNTYNIDQLKKLLEEAEQSGNLTLSFSVFENGNIALNLENEQIELLAEDNTAEAKETISRINPERTVSDHAFFLRGLKENGEKDTLVINAFGGAGAGKTTACLGIVEELKKRGYVAEYVQEYAKELVWEENWSKLDGTEVHQYEILNEQMHRMDRLYGKVDFIVTDAPILLNRVYNNELTPEYDAMLHDLYCQYDNFNFVVERNCNAFEQEGRLQNLEESIRKDNEIKEMLKEYGLYFGAYDHKRVPLVINNVILTFKRMQQEHSGIYISNVALAKELRSHGFELTKPLAENIRKINEMTGFKNPVKNFLFFAKHVDEIDHLEAQEIVQKIADEFRKQELEKLIMPTLEL